jgi:CRP-like cAMP-binding protein
LESLGRVVIFKPGESIFEPEAPSDHVVLIVHGRVLVTDPNNEDEIRFELSRGQLVGVFEAAGERRHNFKATATRTTSGKILAPRLRP